MTMTEQEIKVDLSEQQKVHEIYRLIGERGLYVSTSFDIMTSTPEEVQVSGRYSVPLMQPSTQAYASPLLFAALTSLMNHGTMLITGAPGIGKTTGAEYAGHFFTGTPLEEILAAEIQGHPQLTEEKMVASYDLAKLMHEGKRVVIPAKFLQCPVKILDEGNRMPPDVASIIIRLVDTGKVVYGGELLTAKKGPLFVTANYADEGTFEFTPPFLDRFDVAVMVTSPQPWDLTKIRERGDEKLNGSLNEKLNIPEGLQLNFGQIREEIRSLPEKQEENLNMVSAFADFVYSTLRFSEAASDNLVRATKGNLRSKSAVEGHFASSISAYTANELSIRTVMAMNRYAKAYAWFTGKQVVDVDDLKAILPYALWHKVAPTTKGIEDNPKLMSDRLGFVRNLVGKIEGEYTKILGSDSLKNYTGALHLIRTRKFEGNELSPEQIRMVAKKAIAAIGKADAPWALTMAAHIAAEYNKRMMED